MSAPMNGWRCDHIAVAAAPAASTSSGWMLRVAMAMMLIVVTALFVALS